MFDPGELARRTAVKRLMRPHDGDGDQDSEQRTPKQCKVPEARPRHLPIPPATAPSARGPAPYPNHLTPNPSALRPHCLARERLKRWTPALQPPALNDAVVLTEEERERVKETMLHAWGDDTQLAYGAGLLMWHCFCDEKGVPEVSRAPAASD